MDVIICKTTEAACQLTAKIIADLVKKNPKAVLGLATGRTMERVYACLAERAKKTGLSFKDCQSFNLDEYWGLPGTDKNSYRYYMNFHLFDHIDIDKAKTHVPNGAAKCPVKECEAYEAAMKEAGGVDLQLLGIGVDGHIGFNEPLSPLSSRTRKVVLSAETLEQNCEMFGGDPKNVPTHALTMGIGTILEAKATLLLATGSSKAEILAAASGVKLGKLLNVEYNWHNAAFDSATSVTADNAMMPRMAKAAFAANMTPEDVEIVDSAGFVWEIE